MPGFKLMVYNRHQQTLSVISQIINIFGFADHMVSVTSTQLCHCSQGMGMECSNETLLTETALGLSSISLLTSIFSSIVGLGLVSLPLPSLQGSQWCAWRPGWSSHPTSPWIAPLTRIMLSRLGFYHRLTCDEHRGIDSQNSQPLLGFPQSWEGFWFVGRVRGEWEVRGYTFLLRFPGSEKIGRAVVATSKQLNLKLHQHHLGRQQFRFLLVQGPLVAVTVSLHSFLK